MKISLKLRSLLREPLNQFLLIGSLIYLAYALVGGEPQAAKEQIIVTQGEIQSLEDKWLKLWNRPPTPQERQGMIDEHVKEKVLYNAALDMGLDRDDIIIRRRLAQKIEFLTSDLLTPPAPEERELEAYFDGNKAQYTAPDLISITQVYFDPDRRNEQTLKDAESALLSLQGQGEPGTETSLDYGDRFMLQSYFAERTEAELAKLFGSEFAKSLFALPAGQWHGPILSGYGTHLVYVHNIISGDAPTYVQVKDAVQRDWESAQLEDLNETFINGIMAQYEVVFAEEEEVPGD